MLVRRCKPLETAIQAAIYDFANHLYWERAKGATWRQLAEANDISRSTATRYARRFEKIGESNGWVDDLGATRNTPHKKCGTCGKPFPSTRADARYCSNACRQDAYRKRRLTEAA